MVEIVIPGQLRDRLQEALRAGGDQEIGGVMMGECIEPGLFRLADLTIQGDTGGVASFVRGLTSALVALRRFFLQTRANYARFNYLGEWHSHPLFTTAASDRDIESMIEIAKDPSVGANFVALLIVRLDQVRGLQAQASVFWPDGSYERASLTMEAA